MSGPHTQQQRVSAGAPALTRLLAHRAPGFAQQDWAERAVLVTRDERAGDEFADLFSPAAVDELVARRGLRTPFVRMAKDGVTLPESRFTAGGGVGAGVSDQVSEDKVLALFADGATIVLQGLHRTWSPVVDFSQQLAAELGHPVQVNAYVTPQQSRGFDDHYDVHDVFVLQVHGQKRWSIHEPVLRAPLRDQPWTDRRAEVEQAAAGPPDLHETLGPGDCLYLPRGYIHSATALGGVSIHLTIGIHGWTRQHLAEALLEHARAQWGADPGGRASLGLTGHDSELTDEIAATRRRLVEEIESVPEQDVRAWLSGRARAAQRPEPIAPLSQLDAAQMVDGGTVVRLRQHLMLHRQPGEHGQVVIASRAGRFGIPETQAAVLDTLTHSGPARVADLHDDLEVAVAAVRSLLRHGVVCAETAAST